VKYILELSLKLFSDAGVSFGGVRVVGGPFLDRHNIMVDHYGVISRISKEGYPILSDVAKEKLSADFASDLAACGQPLGGHQWLAKNPEFSPLALATINDNVGTTRLAGGSYLCKFKVSGKVQLVLNSFHPYQLVPFIRKGSALIVFDCRSKLSWADLRTKLCGSTNPLSAVPGSFRHALLTNKEQTGMVTVSISSNGCHMSAGPLEGLVELQRFFSDRDNGNIADFSSFGFGALLQSRGLTGEQINKLAKNPNIHVGDKSESVFDMTEEKDAVDSANILKGVL